MLPILMTAAMAGAMDGIHGSGTMIAASQSAIMTQNAQISEMLSWILVIVLAGVVVVLLLRISRLGNTSATSFESPPPPAPIPPEGFRQLFSQAIDPIGDLHVWRLRTESDLRKWLAQHQLGSVGMLSATWDELLGVVEEQNSTELTNLVVGIQLVRNLEGYLKAQCEISIDNPAGTVVQYDASGFKSITDDLVNGDEALVVEPGWRWRSIIIRYARVSRR